MTETEKERQGGRRLNSGKGLSEGGVLLFHRQSSRCFRGLVQRNRDYFSTRGRGSLFRSRDGSVHTQYSGGVLTPLPPWSPRGCPLPLDKGRFTSNEVRRISDDRDRMVGRVIRLKRNLVRPRGLEKGKDHRLLRTSRSRSGTYRNYRDPDRVRFGVLTKNLREWWFGDRVLL